MGIFDKTKQNLPMTTSFSFDGYKIDEYLGVFSGESALGTGFISSFEASISDVLGRDSSLYSDKLSMAGQNALNVLQSNAKIAGGNAIIGVDIKMASFSADIIGIIATGTVVRISKIDESVNSILNTTEAKVLQISHAQKGLPFQPISVTLSSPEGNRSKLSLDILSLENINLTGILTNITFITIFEETFSLPDIEFLSFTAGKRFHYVSDYTPCAIPDHISRTVNSVDVQIKKYILDGSIITCDTPMELMDPAELVEDSTTDSVKSLLDIEKETENFLLAIESLTNSRKILDYALNFNESHQNMLAPALLEIIESTAKTERLYGNSKRETINKVHGYLKEHSLFE